MSSSKTSTSPDGHAFRRDEFRGLLWIGSSAALAVLLLIGIGVLDGTVVAHGSKPRVELTASLLGIVTYLGLSAVSRGKLSWLHPRAALSLPFLAALLFLGFEATTLVLCPYAVEFSDVIATQRASFGNLSLEADALTAIVAWCLSFACLLAVSAMPILRDRRWLVRELVAGSGLGALLSLLVPVAGPHLGVLPMPTVETGAASVAAVPRTGFICIPAIIAVALAWSCLSDVKRQQNAEHRLSRFAVVALAGAAVLLELATARFTWLSVGLSVLLVACTRVAVRALPAASNSLGTDEARVTSFGASHPTRRARVILTVVFFFSGMAALVYQVVFAKGLALTFGSTSHASTIVLATYMGGLAFGSWFGGRWAARMAKPVVGYALAELGIAAICALAPFTLRLARAAYVAMAEGADPSEPWLVALQLGLGAVVLVPPTWLMGLTLPLLTKQFLDEQSGLGGSAGLLYTANTLGAAIGASMTGYYVLPTLGIAKSLFVAVMTNVIVACCALVAARVGREPNAAKRGHTPSNTTESPNESVGPAIGPIDVERSARHLALIATIQLTVGGFVTFGLETTFVHLLATVAGTSTYAFSLMLFAFLIGLGLGSTIGRRWLPKREHLPIALLACQLTLAVTLLLASRCWDYLPGYFAAFGRWPYTLTFAAREFVRFVVCLVVMLPPAICIGAQFPIAMEAVGLGWPRAKLQALGLASALNTVGNIAGALVIGFVALPRLGSHRTLAALTAICILLAALPVLLAEGRRRHRMLVPVAAAAIALLVQPPEFDLTRLSSGGNVYFRPQYYGRVIDHAESLDGGLTAVALSHESTNNPVKTLLTNGKFQGNDRRDSSGEMVAQSSFAIAPLLHNDRRNRALVIGFGTGTTTRVLDEAGFEHVAVAELSGDIVSLADRHFSSINNAVIHRPNVKVHVTDGRNYLLLDRHRYDLISIELSSIWFAGAANLYNDEFYALVEPRLAEGGVLQQWVQLHRLSHRDIMTILVTLRQRFPRIWMYFLGKQGIVVACKTDCLPSSEAVDRLQSEARLRNTLALFRDGLRDVLRGRILTPDGLDRLIADYRAETKLGVSQLLSTDDNLFLEYSTPKGNVREYDESIAENEAFLARHRASNPFEATRLQLEAGN